MITAAINLKRNEARWARVKAIVHERREMLNALRKILRLGLILTNTDHDSWALFLEDASTQGKVRYQTFDAKGFHGHLTHNNLDEALQDAFQSGYRYPDDGALERVAGTPEWETGMAIQSVRDDYNRGKITWDQMFARIAEINDAVPVEH